MSRPEDDPEFRRTLLIGSEALLGAWSEHAAEASHVIAVAHTDLARTLDILDQTRPEMVVVEQALAGTERGQVLMERLHTERALRGLDISLLPADGVARLLSAGPRDIHPQRWLAGLARPLPPRPPRGAARVRARDEERMSIDGHTVTLLDLSATGARVRSSGLLRPNQHVRVVLSARGSMKTPGIVVWSTLVSGPPLHYCAGIAFTAPIPELTKEPKSDGATKGETSKKPRVPRKRKVR